jgi:hypothetical protein
MHDSHHRRLLADIERQLTAEDPELARALGQFRPRAAPHTTMALGVAATVLSTLGILLALAVLNGFLLVASAAGLAASWIWVHRMNRHRRMR